MLILLKQVSIFLVVWATLWTTEKHSCTFLRSLIKTLLTLTSQWQLCSITSSGFDPSCCPHPVMSPKLFSELCFKICQSCSYPTRLVLLYFFLSLNIPLICLDLAVSEWSPDLAIMPCGLPYLFRMWVTLCWISVKLVRNLKYLA